MKNKQINQPQLFVSYEEHQALMAAKDLLISKWRSQYEEQQEELAAAHDRCRVWEAANDKLTNDFIEGMQVVVEQYRKIEEMEQHIRHLTRSRAAYKGHGERMKKELSRDKSVIDTLLTQVGASQNRPLRKKAMSRAACPKQARTTHKNSNYHLNIKNQYGNNDNSRA